MGQQNDNKLASIIGKIDQLCHETSSSIEFFNRTLEQWTESVEVVVDGDANPIILKQYMAQIIEKLNEIERPLEYLSFLREHFKSLESTEFNRVVNEILDSSKKVSKVKAEIQAQRAITNITRTLNVINMLLDFFKNLQKKLYRTYEIINTMNVAEGYLQKLERIKQ